MSKTQTKDWNGRNIPNYKHLMQTGESIQSRLNKPVKTIRPKAFCRLMQKRQVKQALNRMATAIMILMA